MTCGMAQKPKTGRGCAVADVAGPGGLCLRVATGAGWEGLLSLIWGATRWEDLCADSWRNKVQWE